MKYFFISWGKWAVADTSQAERVRPDLVDLASVNNAISRICELDNGDQGQAH